jgi:serine phosphatase RsbU (regulator of sigma subunit)
MEQPQLEQNSHYLLEQLKQQNEMLKSQLMSTSLIHEFTKVLHTCTDFNSITKTVLLAIQEIIEFDRVILFNVDRDSFHLNPSSWVGLSAVDKNALSISVGFEGGEITDAIFLNRHIVVEEPDVENDVFCKKLDSSCYLVIPLVLKVNKRCWEAKNCTRMSCPAYQGYNPYCWSISGSSQMIEAKNENERRAACINCSSFKVEGVLWMDRKYRNTPVTSDDITVLTAIINIAGIVIENFRILDDLDKANTSLHQANVQLKIVNHDLQVAQGRIRSDLEHARVIQQGLLPQNLSGNADFNLSARYLSADAVGGDYYDVFTICPGKYGIVVADVSGHGVASALIMSMAKMLLKTYSSNETSPQKTLEYINETFLSEIKTDNFVTIFYAVLDTSKHTITYTSAGHCPIFYIDKTDNSSILIKADGLFMGVFQDMMLCESTFEYKPGTLRFVLFTDGLIEARKITDEMYGIDRLIESSKNSIALHPEDAVNQILKDQQTFCGNEANEDDVTLLVLDL